MPVFTVHAPASLGLSSEPEDDIVLIREGFSWRALVFGPLWALVHRLWLGFLVWLMAIILISIAGSLFGDAVAWALYIGFAIWFAGEARDFRRAKLSGKDWRLVSVVDAGNPQLAERRFFQKQAAERGTIQPPPATDPPPLPSPRSGGFPPMVGYTTSDRP